MVNLLYYPNTLNIRYLNVQHFTKDKEASLIGHLTEGSPDVILITSHSRKKDEPIKIQGYLTFSTNKSDGLHAGSAIAVKKGLKFNIKNDFVTDTIGAKVNNLMTNSNNDLLLATTAPPPPQTRFGTLKSQYL